MKLLLLLGTPFAVAVALACIAVALLRGKGRL